MPFHVLNTIVVFAIFPVNQAKKFRLAAIYSSGGLVA